MNDHIDMEEQAALDALNGPEGDSATSYDYCEMDHLPSQPAESYRDFINDPFDW